MRAIDIIEKKRDGFELTKEEIDFMVSGYVDGSIADYQMSSFLMAIYFKGMSDDESTTLAQTMLESGDTIDLSMIDGIKVDKHSTGGVGDKTTLIIAPLVASLGINFAKMSGRGLGHTGGTLDKLESIKGYNISISPEDFINQVKRIKLALVGQTGNLVPADKKMYALRDVSGSVPSIPLIASSIMSKKLASGADVICLDVKVGSGAFMKTLEDAKKLATLMVNIGKNCDKKMTAVLTNMEEPLGYSVGNSLEVIEAIDALNGNGPKDLMDICLTISAYLAIDAKVCKTYEEAITILNENINNKKALDYLALLVEAQGGDKKYIYDTSLFKKSLRVIEVKSKTKGYISRIDALKIGHGAMILGAGRENLKDSIDHSVGIVLNKKVGDFVNDNEVLAYVHLNEKGAFEIENIILEAFEYSNEVVTSKLILDIIR